jgi:hypothetical protein
MRKFIVAAVVAALGAAVLAVPASASFDHHFSVLGKQTSGHRVGENRFVFRDKLLDPSNPRNRVGRDRGECRFNAQARKLECHALIHLNGEIGGFGDIKVSGDIGRGDHRVVVLGGSDDFNGVAGKMLLHSVSRDTDKLHFDLVR